MKIKHGTFGRSLSHVQKVPSRMVKDGVSLRYSVVFDLVFHVISLGERHGSGSASLRVATSSRLELLLEVCRDPEFFHSLCGKSFKSSCLGQEGAPQASGDITFTDDTSKVGDGVVARRAIRTSGCLR